MFQTLLETHWSGPLARANKTNYDENLFSLLCMYRETIFLFSILWKIFDFKVLKRKKLKN